ncbi:MAG: ATP-binding protein [Candidatus Aenigmarchaeota archaeon]|nr:ATP-binding protein [Candidatus Aenigmarchaeota archaeon]
MKEFYDRENETGLLKKRVETLKSGELLIMYGRRRVGKTEIVKQFLDHIEADKMYFYLDLVERPVAMDALSEAIKTQLGDTVKLESWDTFFEYLHTKSEHKKLVVVIDEFQRFLEIAPEFMTKLQRHWDETLKHDKIMILAVGSSIGMMLKIAKSYAAPLYGRVDSRIKISPFRYVDFRKMFSHMTEEEKIKYYAVFGGTPHYLARVKDAEGDLYKRVYSLVVAQDGKLRDEAEILMEAENLRTHAKYNSILQAISMGKETTKEIEDYTHIKRTTLPTYLKNLEKLLDIVEKIEPAMGKERHGRYRISDNFFRFWYKFVFPNQSLFTMANGAEKLHIFIKDNMNAYIAKTFEHIVHELLLLYSGRTLKEVEIDFEQIGSWWDRKANEIDVVAFNKKKRRMLLGELKWTHDKVGVDLLDDLIRKTKLLNFSGEYKLMLVSKSGFTEKCIERMEQMKCVHLDLADIEKLFDEA